MNRFNFLGAEKDEQGIEWCFIFDSETGDTLKSRVRMVSKIEGTAPRPPVRIPVEHIGAEVTPPPTKVAGDPAGEMETPEQRKARLGGPKVPPAFLGNISRMNLDPSKNDGRTDVTPQH